MYISPIPQDDKISEEHTAHYHAHHNPSITLVDPDCVRQRMNACREMNWTEAADQWALAIARIERG